MVDLTMRRKIIFKNCQSIVGQINVPQSVIESLHSDNIILNVMNDKNQVTFEFDDDTQIEQVMTWIIDYIDYNVQIIDNLNRLWNKLRKFVNTEKSRISIDMLKYRN